MRPAGRSPTTAAKAWPDMATGYQLSEMTGLLCDLRDYLDPSILDRMARQAESLTNAQADGILRILRDAKLERDHERNEIHE